jgi:hypothetical protein
MSDETTPYFWRIVIKENGLEYASGQGTETSAKEAAHLLSLWLHKFYLHKFPKENGNTIEIHTIYEKVAGWDGNRDDAKAGRGHAR